MSKQLLGSDERWTRYSAYYEQSQLEVLRQELPAAIVGVIEYVQEEFRLIEQQQNRERVRGGALNEYEAALILALASLPENFDRLELNNALEVLFSDALSSERIARVGSGELIINEEQWAVIKTVIAFIKKLAQA